MISFHPSIAHTEQWHKFRERGLGGSDVGAVMQMNVPSRTTIDVWGEKVGIKEPIRILNEAMLNGTFEEDYVADLWQFYDGLTNDFDIPNYVDNKWANYMAILNGDDPNTGIIRTMHQEKGYYTNDKYPWLFASCDRFIDPGQPDLLGGTIEKKSPLEIKTISGFTQDQWKGGVPIYHIAQVTVYMLILECDYCEIAYLRDGRIFTVKPIPLMKEFANRLVEITKEFWYGNVEAARNDIANVFNYEPLPDTSTAYRAYIEDKFIRDEETRIALGDDKEWDLAAEDKTLLGYIKLLEEQRQLRQNKLFKIMQNKGADVITFGDEGRIDWKVSKNGTRRYDNRIKVTLSEYDKVMLEQIQKLNLDYLK